MNSKTLIETGFCEWIPLKTLSFSTLPQDKSSVVIIVDKELSGKPESDILYIGRAKNVAKKILGGYLAGYGRKSTKKINQMLFDDGYIERAAVTWTLTEKPRLMQKELLTKFKEEHGGFPAWNNKKKLLVKPKPAPAFKPKKTTVTKTTAVAPKAVANSVKKSTPKSRIVPTKKNMAKDEISAKTESSATAATSALDSEREKTKNEAASDKQMST
jgi:hypothetical protein